MCRDGRRRGPGGMARQSALYWRCEGLGKNRRTSGGELGMKHLATLVAVTALAGLSACTMVPVEERAAQCAQTDWTKFGVNDGTLGVPTSDRSDKFADCAEVGQPADLVAYQAGRTQGLQTYCTLENGYKVGLEGRRYDNVCPPSLAADFLQGYERGKKERPSYALSPSIGIGVGTGGTRVGVGNRYRTLQRVSTSTTTSSTATGITNGVTRNTRSTSVTTDRRLASCRACSRSAWFDPEMPHPVLCKVGRFFAPRRDLIEAPCPARISHRLPSR